RTPAGHARGSSFCGDLRVTRGEGASAFGRYPPCAPPSCSRVRGFEAGSAGPTIRALARAQRALAVDTEAAVLDHARAGGREPRGGSIVTDAGLEPDHGRPALGRECEQLVRMRGDVL